MYKKKGNIVLLASVFLSLGIIFFCGIYKIISINISEKNNMVFKSTLELSKKETYIVENLERYANEVGEIELDKSYSYPNNLVDSKLAIGDLKMKFNENEVSLSYLNLGDKKIIQFKVDWKKFILCNCDIEGCYYKQEKIIFIPQRRVK